MMHVIRAVKIVVPRELDGTIELEASEKESEELPL